MAEIVQVRVDPPCGTITINRPEVRNALSLETVREITQALSDLHLEKRVRSIIVTGAGDHFCVGTDLKELQSTYEMEDPFLRWQDEVMAIKELIEMMLRCPKPILAAVSGWVAGTGLALMLAADMVIAGHDSRFQVLEPQRGLSAGLTTPLLSFRIGNAATSQLLLAGLPISADKGIEIGLVHEIVSPDLIWARSHQLSIESARGAHESHQMNKRMLNESIGENLFTMISIGAADMATARITDAAREGITAFLEKRPPKWD